MAKVARRNPTSAIFCRSQLAKVEGFKNRTSLIATPLRRTKHLNYDINPYFSHFGPNFGEPNTLLMPMHSSLLNQTNRAWSQRHLNTPQSYSHFSRATLRYTVNFSWVTLHHKVNINNDDSSSILYNCPIMQIINTLDRSPVNYYHYLNKLEVKKY